MSFSSPWILDSGWELEFERADETSPEVTVKEDVKLLRESSFFKGMEIVGLVQNTETGLLKEVFVE